MKNCDISELFMGRRGGDLEIEEIFLASVWNHGIPNVVRNLTVDMYLNSCQKENKKYEKICHADNTSPPILVR